MFTALEFSSSLCDLPTSGLTSSNPSSCSTGRANSANFKYDFVTPRTKFLQRLHIAPRLISKPYIHMYSSFGPPIFSKLLSSSPTHPTSHDPTRADSYLFSNHRFLSTFPQTTPSATYVIPSPCAYDKRLCIPQNPTQMSILIFRLVSFF